MQFDDALNRAAVQFGLDADRLRTYAAEDDIGGWPVSLPPHVDWPGGSIWSVEGKFLYALTRALQPAAVLECGTKWGCSTSHLLAAAAHYGGRVVSVDKGVDTDIPPGGYGSRIPASLRDRWTLHCPVSAQDFIDADTTPFDLAYEDTIHQYEETADILRRLKARDSIQVIVSHDIGHPWVGHEMRQAWEAVFGAEGGAWVAYCIEPSDCGLAVWKRP